MTIHDVREITKQAQTNLYTYPKHPFRVPIASALERLFSLISELDTGKTLADIEFLPVDATEEIEVFTAAKQMTAPEEEPKKKRGRPRKTVLETDTSVLETDTIESPSDGTLY